MKVCLFLAALAASSLAVSPPYYETCDDCMGAYLAGIEVIAQLIKAESQHGTDEALCDKGLATSIQAKFEQLKIEIASCDKLRVLLETYETTLTNFYFKVCGPVSPPGPKNHCFAYGNVYVPVNDCAGFYQVASKADKKPSYDEIKLSHKCDYGLKFDVYECVCVREMNAYCPEKTKQVPDAYKRDSGYPTAPYGGGDSQADDYHSDVDYCVSNGQVYTAVNRCTAFDQRPGNKKPRSCELKISSNCPADLLFDVKKCACNYPHLVECGYVDTAEEEPKCYSPEPPVYKTEPPKPTPSYRSLLDLITALEVMEPHHMG